MSALTFFLAAAAVNELHFKVETILDEPEMVEECIARGCTFEELDACYRALGRRPVRPLTFSRPVWTLLASEARNAASCGLAFMDHVADRIESLLKGESRLVAYIRPVRPARATGNKVTEFFANTSRYPDALVKQMIAFILEGGRLPAECRVTIEQSIQLWCSGRAYGASKARWYNRGRAVRRASARGGSVYVAANVEHCKPKVRGGHGGYLPIEVYGATEDFFAVLAHEIRHVFQGFNRHYRECRKVRRFTFGTNAKLCEIDASLFEVRTLRRFRREWPSPALKVLPLP